MVEALVRQPMYQQLNEALRGLVSSGEFKTGARFLSEREVAMRFEVSRVTANKALSNLVSEGILEFRKGIGTYVRGGVLDYDLQSLVSFTGKAAAAGKRPSTRVLSFDTITAASVSPRIAAALRVSGGDWLYTVERLRLADGVPVILERRFVVERLCPGLHQRDFGASLYGLWTKQYKLEIAGADQTIQAAAIRGGEARSLKVSSGAAGLVVKSVGWLRDGKPLWWERTLYRGDAYAFRNRLGPIQTARPATGLFLNDGEEDLA
jgi:GntR family transcriptional regulator